MSIRVLGEFGPTWLIIELAASKVMEIADYIDKVLWGCEIELEYNVKKLYLSATE